MDTEKRFSLETRSKGRTLYGYAAVFNSVADIFDFKETVKPGAFKRSLASGNDILCLCDHDASRVLGRSKSGTLKLYEDTKGLGFEVAVPATTWGNDILELVQRGDAGGCSFAFTLPPNGDSWDGNRRSLVDVTLHEISIVAAVPAYDDTIVSARSKRGIYSPRLNLARKFLETL